jgi:hypothetical protein
VSELEKFGVNLKPGDSVIRRELHEALGGQTQSGISPSTTAAVVFLFSSPRGADYGYFDGPNEDGFFHYSGEGQRGDQEMKRGNKVVRDHQAAGRELHLFRGAGKGAPVTYEGEFEYVDHYQTDAPEVGNGPLRRVIMFRLRPLGALPQRTTSLLPLPTSTIVEGVPIEQHLTEMMLLNPAHEPTEGERREAQLVQRYRQYLEERGGVVHRHRIRPAGELKPLFSDLFDVRRNVLVEAKGSTTREAVRMAIGQLLDYSRFLNPAPELAVLFPSRPREELVALLQHYKIMVIFASDDDFEEVGA